MPGAGDLRERLRFEVRPATTDDGYGNVEGAWQARFITAARIRPLAGSETVIAARLSGVQPVRITVRSSVETRAVTAGWRAVDCRDASRIFNVRAPANFDERNRYIDIMAEAGVPT